MRNVNAVCIMIALVCVILAGTTLVVANCHGQIWAIWVQVGLTIAVSLAGLIGISIQAYKGLRSLVRRFWRWFLCASEFKATITIMLFVNGVLGWGALSIHLWITC